MGGGSNVYLHFAGIRWRSGSYDLLPDSACGARKAHEVPSAKLSTVDWSEVVEVANVPAQREWLLRHETTTTVPDIVASASASIEPVPTVVTTRLPDTPAALGEDGGKPSIRQLHDASMAILAAMASDAEAAGEDVTVLIAARTKHERCYDKTCAGYLRGGTFETCLRPQTRLPRYLIRFVRDQVDVADVDALTSSAREFQAFKQERLSYWTLVKEMPDINRSLASLIAELDALLASGAAPDMDAVARLDALYRDLQSRGKEVSAKVRRYDIAARAVVPREKKRWMTKTLISAALGTIAGAISVASAAVPGGLAIAALISGLMIRAYGVVSICCFERAKGWKAAESEIDASQRYVDEQEKVMLANYSMAESRLASLRHARAEARMDALERVATERFNQIDSRFDNLETRLSTEVADLRAEMRAGFERIAQSRYPAIDAAALARKKSPAEVRRHASCVGDIARTPAGAAPKYA